MTTTARTKKTPVAQAAEQEISDAEREAMRVTMHMMRILTGQNDPVVLTGPKRWIVLISKVTLYALGVTSAIFVCSYLSTALLMFGLPMFLIAVIELTAIVLSSIIAVSASDTIVNFIVRGGVNQCITGTGRWLRKRFSRKQVEAS